MTPLSLQQAREKGLHGPRPLIPARSPLRLGVSTKFSGGNVVQRFLLPMLSTTLFTLLTPSLSGRRVHFCMFNDPPAEIKNKSYHFFTTKDEICKCNLLGQSLPVAPSQSWQPLHYVVLTRLTLTSSLDRSPLLRRFWALQPWQCLQVSPPHPSPPLPRNASRHRGCHHALHHDQPLSGNRT